MYIVMLIKFTNSPRSQAREREVRDGKWGYRGVVGLAVILKHTLSGLETLGDVPKHGKMAVALRWLRGFLRCFDPFWLDRASVWLLFDVYQLPRLRPLNAVSDSGSVSSVVHAAFFGCYVRLRVFLLTIIRFAICCVLSSVIKFNMRTKQAWSNIKETVM